MPNSTRGKWLQDRIDLLAESTDPQELEMAAVALASSDDPDAIDGLAGFLSQKSFLERLDEPDSENRIFHLRSVLAPLMAQPSPETARLCLKLADEPIYLENDRKSLVLRALAAVTPMDA